MVDEGGMRRGKSGGVLWLPHQQGGEVCLGISGTKHVRNIAIYQEIFMGNVTR